MINCSDCIEQIDFRKRINRPIKHELFYHFKYHSIFGEIIWLITKQIPTTIKNAFTWSWFYTYEGNLSFHYFLRPFSGWKLAWDIAYYCNEVW